MSEYIQINHNLIISSLSIESIRFTNSGNAVVVLETGATHDLNKSEAMALRELIEQDCSTLNAKE